MVLMHLYKGEAKNIIVAHFDHGIRPNSHDDYLFVERKAKEYNMHFVGKVAKLGLNCSEEKARNARYSFLEKLAQENKAIITTAHHSDDVVESIIINLIRGTGWRGLAPMRNKNIDRPLILLSKQEIYRIAAENELSFREDQTNSDTKYLRNRIRELLKDKKALKTQLLELYKTQSTLANEIDSILANLIINDDISKRELYRTLPDEVALELLRELLKKYGISQTRPQLGRALAAIKEYGSGKSFTLNKKDSIKINRRYFEVVTSVS